MRGGIWGKEEEKGEQGKERSREKKETTGQARHGGASDQAEQVEGEGRGGKPGGVQGSQVGNF